MVLPLPCTPSCIWFLHEAMGTTTAFRLAARGDEGLLESNGLAVGQGRGFVREVQRRHGDTQHEIDVVVVKILLGVEEECLPGLLATQELFGEGRTVVGHVGLLADQRDGTTCVEPAELLGGLTGGEATADEKVLGRLHAVSAINAAPVVHSPPIPRPSRSRNSASWTTVCDSPQAPLASE